MIVPNFYERRKVHSHAMHKDAKRILKLRRYIMWTKPAATEMRFGFEVTMYVMNK